VGRQGREGGRGGGRGWSPSATVIRRRAVATWHRRGKRRRSRVGGRGRIISPIMTIHGGLTGGGGGDGGWVRGSVGR